MKTRKFWPLDFDPEGEIYENVAWDLPGYKRARHHREGSVRPSARRRSTIASART